jgi:hypothetical protein
MILFSTYSFLVAEEPIRSQLEIDLATMQAMDGASQGSMLPGRPKFRVLCAQRRHLAKKWAFW